MNFDNKFDRREPLVLPDRKDLQIALQTFFRGKNIESFEPLTGGFNNTNLKLRFEGVDTPFVVRISGKPRMEIEAELSVIESLGDSVPVPKVLHVDLNNSILKKHVVVFEFLNGTSLHSVEDSWTESETIQFAENLGPILAAIHSHKFSGSGLLGPDLSIREPFDSFSSGIVAKMLECVTSDSFRKRVSSEEADELLEFIVTNSDIIKPVQNDSYLVHSDCNQKNILAAQKGNQWIVSGILDWEFAFSGSPLMDFGNFFRFEDEMPRGYSPALTNAYTKAGGKLPPTWRKISKFLDLINDVMFLSDKNERPKAFATARQVIFKTLESWSSL